MKDLLNHENPYVYLTVVVGGALAAGSLLWVGVYALATFAKSVVGV